MSMIRMSKDENENYESISEQILIFMSLIDLNSFSLARMNEDIRLSTLPRYSPSIKINNYPSTQSNIANEEDLRMIGHQTHDIERRKTLLVYNQKHKRVSEKLSVGSKDDRKQQIKEKRSEIEFQSIILIQKNMRSLTHHHPYQSKTNYGSMIEQNSQIKKYISQVKDKRVQKIIIPQVSDSERESYEEQGQMLVRKNRNSLQIPSNNVSQFIRESRGVTKINLDQAPSDYWVRNSNDVRCNNPMKKKKIGIY